MTRLLSRLVLGIRWFAAFAMIAQAQDPLTASKTSISFGSIPVLTSVSDSFYVRNGAQFGYQITSVTHRSPQFVIEYDPSGVIFPLDSIKIRVTFSPDSVGSAIDTVVVTHNAGPSPLRVALSGAAINPIRIASPRTGGVLSSLFIGDEFATVQRLDSVTILNGTSSTVNVSSVTVGNPEFEIVTTLPISIAPSDSQRIVFGYRGTSVGRDFDTLTIVHDYALKGSSPLKFPISARARASLRFVLYSGTTVVYVDTQIVRPNLREGTDALPRWQLAPSAPKIPVDSARIVGINLLNRGSGPIQVDSIRTKGPHLTPLTPPYLHREGAAYDRAILFSYQPKDLSSPVHRDTIMVFTNDTIPGGNPLTVPFEGTSTRAVYVLNPANGTSLSYGTIALGTFVDNTMRIYNFQDISLTIDSMRFAVKDPKYSITTTATNLVINPGDTGKVNIRFTANDTLPSLGYVHIDTVIVYASVFPSPVRFPLSGSIFSSIVFTPSVTAISFGAVRVNQPIDSTIMVYNRTTTAYKIDSLSLVYGNDFIVLSNVLTTQLPPGDSTAIQLQFKPLSSGTLQDTLSIWHNFEVAGIPNPRKVSLVGTGSTQQIISPGNYITVDNVRGPDGFPTASPDSSYVETGPFWQNASSLDYGGTGTGHRRSPNLSGSPSGSSARWTLTVDSSANYLIYHYLMSSPNAGQGYYVHLRKFGVGGIVDSLRYDLQNNVTDLVGGTWYPLMFHHIDGVGPNAASVTIGADNTSTAFLRVDAIRFLRSTQKADLEFGRRTVTFAPDRVPEQFGQVTLSDELVRQYRLYNLGSDTLVVTDIKIFPTLTPVPWFYTKNFTKGTPIKIPPLTALPDGQEAGGYFDLQLAFSPYEEGSARDSIVIVSNDENEPEAYNILYGEGLNYNFIMNASTGNTEPHFRAPAPPEVPMLPLYRETANGAWANSVRSPAQFPIMDGNASSRVNIGASTTLPHQAYYEFQLPEVAFGKIPTDGRYILEYGGPIGSPNGYTRTLVKVTHSFGVPADSEYYSATLLPSTWLQIGGSAKTFFLAPGGPITIEFARNNQTEAAGGSGYLRTDLLKIRKVPTGALIGVNVAQGAVLNFGDVSFRNPAGLDGRANKKEMIIGSRGEMQIVVSNLRFRDGRYFRLVGAPSIPLYLRALTGEQTLSMEFIPDRIEPTFRDTLEIVSNSTRDSVLLVPVLGNGIGGIYVLDDDGSTEEVSSTPQFGGLFLGRWDNSNMNKWQLETSNTPDSIGRGKTRRLLPIYFNANSRFEWYPLIPLDPAAGDSVLMNVAVTVPRGYQNASPRARYRVYSTGGNMTKDTLINQNSAGLVGGSSIIELNLGNHFFLRGSRDIAGGQAFFGHVRVENDTAAVSAYYGTLTNFARRDTFALLADAVILRELDRFQPSITGVEDQNIPLEFSLSQNYPNPFNPTTTIEFTLPEQLPVELRIYDLLGREVATILRGDVMNPGRHIIRWNGRNNNNQSVATGVYFYRIVAGGYVQSKKMVLLK